MADVASWPTLTCGGMVVISGSTPVYPDTSAINRRSRAAMRSVIFGATYPVETLTDNGDDTYTLVLPNYWLNEVQPSVAANQLSYTLVMNPATGTPNNKLIIYCEGHESNGTSLIASVLAEFNSTYDVLDAFMLGMGDGTTQYNTPVTMSDVVNHERIGKAFPDDIMKLHLWHYVAALNTFASTYDAIYLVGFSGGAQMALMVGSLDPRVSACFPMAWGFPDWIAGADPAYSGVTAPAGDYEQHHGPTLQAASRVGQLALAAENWCHSFHDSGDNVLPLSVAEGARMQSLVRTISPNYTCTVTEVGVAHTIQAGWLASISSDLALFA